MDASRLTGDPGVEALVEQSVAHTRAGRYREAWQVIERAVAMDPDNGRARLQHARCAVANGEWTAARSSAVNASKARGLNAEDQMILAAVLAHCGEGERSLDLYRRLESAFPVDSRIQREIAVLLRTLGRAGDAEHACDRCIALNPHDYETIQLRSSLRTQSAARNHVAELTGILGSGTKGWRGAVQVGYALSKELDDLGRCDESFSYLHQAARLRRQHLQYDAADDLKIFPALEQAFNRDAIDECRKRGQGFDSAKPIFVLGLPRTGSTLVERIISSHSLVASVGETDDFTRSFVNLWGEDGKRPLPPRLSLPGASLRLDMRELGERYVASLESRASGRPRILDKLPLNSLNLGLIHLSLPRAKVVHVTRHPIAACFAMFRFLFKQGYPFSYNLSELADYYVAHHRLMAHWRRVLPPGSFLDVAYEDIVHQQRATTRTLLDHLELPWEEACVDFHANSSPTMTGSATQVRQPLYASSVDAWKRYASHLAPLTRQLAAAGIPVESSFEPSSPA
jgi:tetratricopeptide (TPR) repeat protein